MRAVVASAGRADRALAHQRRLAKQQESRKAEQRAQLAEAVKHEREAALRAEELRQEVAELEAEAIRREEEAAFVSELRTVQQKAQRFVEAERSVEASWQRCCAAPGSARARTRILTVARSHV